MESIRKIIEKEEQKNKKNPGTDNREKRDSLNKARRGETIPAAKVVTPKKIKEKSRNALKKKLNKEIKDIWNKYKS